LTQEIFGGKIINIGCTVQRSFPPFGQSNFRPKSGSGFVMASFRSLPSARSWPFIASAGDLVYLWGGKGDTEPDTVFVFSHGTETWTRQLTKGPHPPAGMLNGGCCMSGQHLYLYGGYDGLSNHGELYELNVNTWNWRKLSDGGAGGPGKKRGCRMISYQDQLLVLGGLYDEMPVRLRQVRSSYESMWDVIFTNEVHCFNLTEGKCTELYVSM